MFTLAISFHETALKNLLAAAKVITSLATLYFMMQIEPILFVSCCPIGLRVLNTVTLTHSFMAGFAAYFTNIMEGFWNGEI